MTHEGRVAVVVPARDEERLIGRTLRSIPRWVRDVVVVDDGSSDGTAREARRAGCGRVRIVRHDRNRGVGAAIVTGYRAAFEQGADVAVVMAGDAQMDPRDLRALVTPALAGEADYVKGDRLSHPRVGRAMPALRLWGNRTLSALTRWATGLRVHDSQCGYTAITRSAAERLPLDRLWPGYGYPNDLLGMAAAAGLRVQDVVVRPIYADEQSGVRFQHAALVIPSLLARVWWHRTAFGRTTPTPLPGAEAAASEGPLASADGP